MSRLLRLNDLADLMRLYGYLHPEENSAKESDANVQKTWKAILENPDLRYYGVERDGRIISTCTLTIIPNLTRGCRPYGLMENVVTDPSWRNRGCATEVLQYALKEAWSGGCYKVMLLTGSKREETLRFYEKSGFQRNRKTGFVAYPTVS